MNAGLNGAPQTPVVPVPLTLLAQAYQASAARGVRFDLQEDGTFLVTIPAGGLVLVPLQNAAGEVAYTALIPIGVPSPLVRPPSTVLDANGAPTRPAQVPVREGESVRVLLPLDVTQLDPAWLASLASGVDGASTSG